MTESFEDLWPQLIPSVGATPLISRSSAQIESSNYLCGVVVSVAGEETEHVNTIEDLKTRISIPIAVVGAETDYRVAMSFLHAGGAAYFALPNDLGMLRSWIAERVESNVGELRGKDHAQSQRSRYDFSKLLGKSGALMAALSRASKVIPRGQATVLVTGETGTGKELLARAIHYNGPRSSKPFVEINCTALPENLLEAELFGYEAGAFTDAKVSKPGLIEAGEGGTLFLDEVGDLSLKLQGKLLRVLEEKRVRRLGSIHDREVDVRVVAATNVDLLRAVQDGRFREDLYYRLNVVPIELPPLRERGEDILLLANHFLERFCGENEIPTLHLSREAGRALLSHSWPGNVRELRNAIERAVLLGDGAIDSVHFFPDRAANSSVSAVLPFPASMARIEKAAAKAMTDWCGGNKSEAARALGISRKHLYSLLGTALDDA